MCAYRGSVNCSIIMGKNVFRLDALLFVTSEYILRPHSEGILKGTFMREGALKKYLTSLVLIL